MRIGPTWPYDKIVTSEHPLSVNNIVIKAIERYRLRPLLSDNEYMSQSKFGDGDFHVSQIADEEGYLHQVFKWQPPQEQSRTIVIKSREELPVIPELETVTVQHLGQEPRLITDAQSKYKKWLSSQNRPSSGDLIVVDATPLGAIKLSLEMKENPSISTYFKYNVPENKS